MRNMSGERVKIECVVPDIMNHANSKLYLPLDAVAMKSDGTIVFGCTGNGFKGG